MYDFYALIHDLLTMTNEERFLQYFWERSEFKYFFGDICKKMFIIDSNIQSHPNVLVPIPKGKCTKVMKQPKSIHVNGLYVFTKKL